MCAVTGITPASATIRFEKIRHETIGIERWISCGLQNAGTLELGQTFELITGKTPEEIEDGITIRGNYIAEESTNQRIA